MAAAAIWYLMDSSQKLIRSSQLHREQPYQIWMQSNQRFISYGAYKLYGLVPKKTRLHKSRSSRDELEFDLSNFV